MALPPQPWPTGQCEQLEPLIARVLAPNGSPYTFTGTQTYLVGDDAGVVVIDPGPADPLHIDALMAAIGSAPVAAICCTHTHRDHSPAAAPLAEATGALIIGCAPLVIQSDMPRADAPFDKTYAPDRVLGDGEAISGDGWSLTALATPGHTSNHLCYEFQSENQDKPALFTGDHIMSWSTTVVSPPDGDMADYLASLALLYERDDRVFYPAHGQPITKTRQWVRGMIGHRKSREKQILRLLEEAPRKAVAMVPLMYKGLNEKLWGAAGQSVLAHLLELERQGLVTCDQDVWTLR